MPTIFGGISFTEDEKRLCRRMSSVAERWPLVKVKTTIVDRGWFGETFPGYSQSKWQVNESQERAYGEGDSIPVLSGGSVKSDWLGIQVILRFEAGEIELWSGGGLTPLFYTFSARNLIIGTDPTIVCAALDSSPDLDPTGLMSLLSLDYQTPSSTLFKQIRRLPPYHYLKGGQNGWGEAQSYVKPLVTSLCNDGGGGVRQAAECLVQAVSKAVGNGDGVCLPLTGGVDSRTLLAAIRTYGSVQSYTRGTPSDAEVVTAAHLAKTTGIPHRSFPFPSQYLERSFPRIVHLTGGCVSAEHGHAIHPLKELMTHGLHTVLPGTNGEFGRAFWSSNQFVDSDNPANFWNRFFRLTFHCNADLVRSIFRQPWDEAILSTAQEIQNEYATDIPVGTGVPQIDLDWIYLLRRIPDFIIWGPYIWNSGLHVVMPFLDYRYLKAVAGLPPAKRLDASIHKFVMQSKSPKLLRIPLAPSGRSMEPQLAERWRARWRRKLGALMGISQGSPQKYASWLRQEESFVKSILFSDPSIDRGLLRLEQVGRIWNDHMRNGNHASLLCKLLTVELACRINIDGMAVNWEG